jgi:hypothetical protein
VSYAGAPGTRTQPNAEEEVAARETHVPPTAVQQQHQQTAAANPQLNATRNQGHPPIAATPRAGAFDAPGVTAAKPIGPAYHPEHPLTKEPVKPPQPEVKAPAPKPPQPQAKAPAKPPQPQDKSAKPGEPPKTKEEKAKEQKDKAERENHQGDHPQQ